jgi:N-acetylglucosaminyl-diphospho-decaprenol L-rhamnosyltransferase
MSTTSISTSKSVAGPSQDDLPPSGGLMQSSRLGGAMKSVAGPSQDDLLPSGGLMQSSRLGGAMKSVAGPSQDDLPPSGGLMQSSRLGGANYTVVIPVLNQLHYTQQCVESLLASGVPASALLIIDNGSTDATPQWLASRPDVRSVRNPVNLGCGGAWTQGALLSEQDWVVLLNNDIVCSHNVIQAQLDAAQHHGLSVVSPALVESDLDYDLAAFTPQFLNKMRGHVRLGWFHGVCFSVRRSVFQKIGFLDTDRLLYGREDAEFLARCKRHGLLVGTVGDAVMHHFGMITQTAMKKELGVSKFGDHRYFYSKVGLNWWGRQRAKWARKAQTRRWVADELARFGLTLHSVHKNKHIEYR